MDPPSVAAGRRRIGQLALAAILLTVAATSMVFVDETQSVIVERFGNIVQVYDHDSDRGPHFKLPWPVDLRGDLIGACSCLSRPDARCLPATKRTSQLTSTFAGRLPIPPRQFNAPCRSTACSLLSRVGSVDLAEARLDSRVRSILTTAIGQVELSHLLGIRNSEQGPPADAIGPLDKLSQSVRNETMRRASEPESIRDRLGIEIVDLRITRLNLPAGNQQAVLNDEKRAGRKSPTATDRPVWREPTDDSQPGRQAIQRNPGQDAG